MYREMRQQQVHVGKKVMFNMHISRRLQRRDCLQEVNTFPPVLHVSVIRFWRVLLVLPPPPHPDARHSEKHNKDALCVCMRVSVLLRGFLEKPTPHQRQRTPYLQKHDVFCV